MPWKSLRDMTPAEIESFRKRVMRYARDRRLEHVQDDIASEAVLAALDMTFGGAGVATRWLASIAIQAEVGTYHSHKRRTVSRAVICDESPEAWEVDGEERQPVLHTPTVIPDPSLWVDFTTKFRSLPKWKQTAFNRVQSYGGPIPQGSLRRASSAVLKDLRGFLRDEYEMEYEHGRKGARKPNHEREMRGGRAKSMRARHKK